MRSFLSTATCWPSKEQELLLRACLLTGDKALAAWQQWENVLGKRTLDLGSHRLLPLLYRNLHNHGIDEPLTVSFKQEYFHTWSQNQFTFHRLAALIREFNQAGIETMLLKGAALVILFYQDAGLRPMTDVDLLVRRNQAKRAIQLLTSLGWKSKYSSPEALIPFEQAGEFRHGDNQNLDLHWCLMWEGRQNLDGDEFWIESITTEIDGVPTHALSPAHQLLHVCVHGAKWNDTSSLRWVADAMMIIRSPRLKVDWDRLVRQAQELQLTLPMRDTLSYLSYLLDASIPREVLNSLQNTTTSKTERWFYQIRLGPNDALKTLPVMGHWINSVRKECEGHLPQRLLKFAQYLQTLWSVKHAWQVPFVLVAKPFRRIYETLKVSLRNHGSPTA